MNKWNKDVQEKDIQIENIKVFYILNIFPHFCLITKIIFQMPNLMFKSKQLMFVSYLFKKQLEAVENDKSGLKQSSSVTEDKYKLAKSKINELSEKMDEVVRLTNKEKDEILAKYRAAKETIRKLLDQVPIY